MQKDLDVLASMLKQYDIPTWHGGDALRAFVAHGEVQGNLFISVESSDADGAVIQFEVIWLLDACSPLYSLDVSCDDVQLAAIARVARLRGRLFLEADPRGESFPNYSRRLSIERIGPCFEWGALGSILHEMGIEWKRIAEQVQQVVLYGNDPDLISVFPSDSLAVA